MELKIYQKRVLRELDEYLQLLKETQSMSEAYKRLWHNRDINVGFGGMPPYNNLLPGVPHVCLKVPTGGGKTLLGCAALRHIFSGIGDTGTKAVVWLVPSNAILEQTIDSLSSPEHDYRRWLDYDFNSRVEIYTGEQAKNGQNFTPSTVREQLSVFIMSYDSLRIKNKEGRKAYQENGALAQFVPYYADRAGLVPDVDDSALIQVINQLRPVVIVDESHNAQSELSIEMLRHLNPSFVLDLTATPRKNSNIISIVDARELKKENMVKLPVIVYNRATKDDVLLDAIQLRKSIEQQAKAEQAANGTYIRPIVLFQAQPKGKETSATFDKLKRELVKLGIPEEEIAIKTSEINELKKVDLKSQSCPIRYIITVNALKEGWDCPFAYILATLANRTSQVDVEQIVGRILRLPETRKHSQMLLNMSYVLTCSNDFRATVENVIKGLNHAGFSDKEFRVGADEAPEKGASAEQTSIEDEPTKTGTEEDFLTINFDKVRERLEYQPENGKDTVNSGVVEMTETAEKIGAAFEEEVNAAVESGSPIIGGSEMRNEIEMKPQYAEDALSLKLPVFVEKGEPSLFSDEMTQEVSKDTLSDGFTLIDKDTQINFNQTQSNMVKVDISDDDLPKSIAITDRAAKEFKAYVNKLPSDSRKEACVYQIYEKMKRIDNIADSDLKGYIQRIVDQMSPDELTEMESEIPLYTDIIKKKIETLMNRYRAEKFKERIDTGEIFCEPRYQFKRCISPVATMLPIEKSLYRQEAEVNNFEYKVIMDVSALDNVYWWHRNIERQGFCLNGNINHYPDFIVKTVNGNIVLIETKGDDRDNSDSQGKMELGNSWRAAAGKGYFYFMVFDQNETGLNGTYTLAKFLDSMKRL